MIAGGPAMGAAGHEAVTPELAPRGDRLGPPGDRWPSRAYLSGQLTPSAVLDDALTRIASMDSEFSS